MRYARKFHIFRTNPRVCVRSGKVFATTSSTELIYKYTKFPSAGRAGINSVTILNRSRAGTAFGGQLHELAHVSWRGGPRCTISIPKHRVAHSCDPPYLQGSIYLYPGYVPYLGPDHSYWSYYSSNKHGESSL
jgi:hypothetical protein